MDKQKRVRGCNYSALEKNILVDLVTKYSGVIEDKRSDGVSLKKREAAWIRVRDEFNSHLNVNPRTVENLKQCYTNMKRNAKKDHANEKVERYKTGGGTFTPVVDDISAEVLAIIQDQVLPLESDDCDAEYNDTLKFLRLFAGEAVHEGSASTNLTTTETENLDMIVEDVILEDEEEFSRDIMDECVPVSVALPSSTPVSAKKKRSRSTGNRGLSGIEDLAAQSSSLCEIEKELLIKKYKKEDQLLDIKIQNALLEQQILKKKLEEVTRID
ncbi:hypothetical protein C0J52_01101 [Blattella germanica]|nr:hypothetical protein C0J52_01101 [Blattella germanica]